MFKAHRKAVLGGFATVATLGLAFGLAAPAQADPSSYRSLSAAGSDTIQDVSNGLAGLVDAGGVTGVFGSYDATGGGNIQTTSGGPSFVRPNGSGDGLKALRASIDPTNYDWKVGSGNKIGGQIDIARSSSKYATKTSTDVAYVPIGLDAVTWAKGSGVTLADIPLGTSIGQDTDGDGIRDLTLKNIFGYAVSGTSTFTLELATDNTVTRTVGIQGSGAQIIPFIPQSGSGTRSFWQGKIGSFSALAKDTYSGGTSVQEHDGSVLAAVPNAVVPFSIAQWIAQRNSADLSTDYGVTVVDRRHGATLGKIDGSAPVVSGKLNSSFPINRDVYFVASTARLNNVPTTAADKALQKFLLGGTYESSTGKWTGAYSGANSLTSSSIVQAIEAFGFGTPTEARGEIAGYRSFGAI